MLSDDAGRWALRRASGPLDPQEQREFDAWLADSMSRSGELLQAEATLALFDRAHAVVPVTELPLSPTRRHALAWGGAALAAGVAGLWCIPDGKALTTQVGQIRRTQLADASRVTLNTHSRVTVALTPQERRLSLDEGEAWFEVAHDESRPFVVSAADARIKATGTAFSVRRLTDGINVLVTEGSVEVWRADHPLERVDVTNGRRAFVPDDGVAIVPVRENDSIDRALAWRSGHLALAGETLDYAVSEINRYNGIQLRVDDPSLGRSPIVGYFEVAKPLAFARLVANLKNARVETGDGLIRLIPQRS